MTSNGNKHGEPPAFAKWLIWLFRKETWKEQPFIASIGSIIAVSAVCSALYGVYRLIPHGAESQNLLEAYRRALGDLASSDIEVRGLAASALGAAFLRYDDPSAMLPGIARMCEDPADGVWRYCRDVVTGDRLRDNEVLAFELNNLIHERLQSLRRKFARPSALQTTSAGEVAELAARAYRLLSTFRTTSEAIRTRRCGLGSLQALAHEAVYEGLDILGFLYGSELPGGMTDEEAFEVAVLRDAIKSLLRSRPLLERYTFITSPRKQVSLYESAGVRPPLPTWFLNVRQRLDRFIPKDRTNAVLADILADPLVPVVGLVQDLGGASPVDDTSLRSPENAPVVGRRSLAPWDSISADEECGNLALVLRVP